MKIFTSQTVLDSASPRKEDKKCLVWCAESLSCKLLTDKISYSVFGCYFNDIFSSVWIQNFGETTQSKVYRTNYIKI